MEYSEFIKQQKNVSGKRVHKVTNSYGINDYYNNYKETVTYTVRLLDRKTFSNVITQVNRNITENFLYDKTFNFPYSLGNITLYQRKTESYIDDKGRLIIRRPIDWDKTLKLWYEDPECKEKKIVVRAERDYIYLIKYAKNKIRLKNSIYLKLNMARKFKLKLKELSNNWENVTTYERE